MSDDTRRADPTLTEHPFPVEVELTPIPTAHHMGGMRNDPILPAQLAAYIAVPCRVCFPDAPEPGCRPCAGTCSGWPRHALDNSHADPGLAWQLGGSDE